MKHASNVKLCCNGIAKVQPVYTCGDCDLSENCAYAGDFMLVELPRRSTSGSTNVTAWHKAAPERCKFAAARLAITGNMSCCCGCCRCDRAVAALKITSIETELTGCLSQSERGSARACFSARGTPLLQAQSAQMAEQLDEGQQQGEACVQK
eukprot:15696-Heterococcus_DN1.PRE.1